MCLLCRIPNGSGFFSIVNVATYLPLSVGVNDEWLYDEGQRIINAKDTNMAVTRGDNQSDGVGLIMQSKNESNQQKFTGEPASAK